MARNDEDMIGIVLFMSLEAGMMNECMQRA
jgi:hypothetical protein